MKKILFLLLVLLLTAACGTANSEGGNDSQKVSGTGEQVEGDQNMNDDQTSDNNLQSIIDQLKFTTDIVAEDNQATFKMKLTNESSKDVDISISSGQQYEIIITDPESDEVVYKYSEGKMFTQAISTETIEPSKSLTWEQTWDYKKDGSRVEGKEYNVEIKLLPREINKEALESNPFVNNTKIVVPAKDQMNPSEDSSLFRNVKVQGENGQYTVTGEAKVFEGVFHYTVEDGHHVFVEEQTVQIDGAPSWDKFEIKVSIKEENLPDSGVLSLILYTKSAKDGKPTNHVPVTLEDFNK